MGIKILVSIQIFSSLYKYNFVILFFRFLFFPLFFLQKMRNKNKRGKVEEKRLFKWLNHLLATFSEYFLRFSPASIHVSQIWLHWGTFVFPLLVVDLKVLLIFFIFLSAQFPNLTYFSNVTTYWTVKIVFSSPKARSRYIYFFKPFLTSTLPVS